MGSSKPHRREDIPDHNPIAIAFDELVAMVPVWTEEQKNQLMMILISLYQGLKNK